MIKLPKGLMWIEEKQRWLATVYFSGKSIHVGYFKSVTQARREVRLCRLRLKRKYRRERLEEILS